MFNNIPRVTKNILIINVLMFIASQAFGPGFYHLMAGHFPTSDLFMPWQPITSMFMHADFRHILFNMIGVIVFGSMLERYFGEKRYLIFYIVTGLGALVLHFGVEYFQLSQMAAQMSPEELSYFNGQGSGVLVEGKRYPIAVIDYNRSLNGSIVGASGALFGLLIGAALKFPNVQLMLLFPPIPIKIKYLAIAYGAFELFSGFSNPTSNIAHFAHLGGMLFGFLLIKYWEKNSNQFRYN